MKRWKKGLSLLLAVCLAGSLCACGNDGGTSAPDPTPPPTEDVPQEVDVPEEDFSEPELEPEFEPEPEGLMIWEPELDASTVAGLSVIGGYIATGGTLYCLDPDTGESTTFCNFPFISGYDLGGYFYVASNNFSEDFTKIAATKRYMDNDERHAGWLDADGNFFDVTEALGMQSKSDFDAPVKYEALGFSNGYFGFYQPIAGKVESDYYYVPLDNITAGAVQEGVVSVQGHPFRESGGLIAGEYSDDYYWWNVTDWIDDTRAIINDSSFSGDYDSLIVDTDAQTAYSYIPGNSRDNWGGHVSPDGQKIAFLSCPRTPEGEAAVDLYVTDIAGGSPVKVEGHPFSLAYCSYSHYNSGTCTLVGWK